MPANISVFDPTAPYRTAEQHERRTLDGLKGTVIGFIDNTKPNFNHLVDDLAGVLVGKHGASSVVKRRKRAATVAVEGEVIRDLAERCDLVIAGSGD